LLSLSWSPTYCLTHPDDRGQCGGKGFGFVLHGLWPQNDGGGYPENCSTEALLDAPADTFGRTLYPSPQLMQHEWQRHGVCSGLTALHYFQTADRAVAVVKIPLVLDAPSTDQSLTKQQIIAAFRSANPSLADRSMTVACSGRRFSEVRVCLTRDLGTRSCGSGVRDSCPSVPLQIRATR
jgi:ribonuclease T2